MITLNFLGPFDLCGEASRILDGCTERDASGIYLWAVKVDDKYRITYIGETGTSFYQRTKEHIIQTLGGNYRVCDVTEMRKGIQKVLWDGLWRIGTRDKLPEFLNRYEELAPHIKAFLQAQVVFVAVMECDHLLRRRIVGAIAFSLRSNIIASSLLPLDIRFRKRKSSEAPVYVVLKSESEIEELPDNIIA
jgi:hypothetical protein